VSRNNAKGDIAFPSWPAGGGAIVLNQIMSNQATVMNNIDAIGFVIVIVLLVWLFVLKR
jgi:hypothetical protein